MRLTARAPMAKSDQPGAEPSCPRQTWTPKLVQERMIEALRWARYNAGFVGPAPIRSLMPHYHLTLEDHLEQGWGLPERAEASSEAEAEAVMRVPLSPEGVEQMLWVLDWQRLYLAPERPGDARILNLWLRCRVYRMGFESARKARGFKLSRQHAYRMKARALAHLSCRLDNEGYYP